VSRGARLAAGAALAVATALALGLGTRFVYTAEPVGQAEIRLTWRARAAPAEQCRRLSEAEREALPVHMRREMVCEGRVASYRLDVVVDGEVRHSSTVKGAGARGDRPLYVYDAIRLAPGLHDLHVVFERVGAERSDRDGDADVEDLDGGDGLGLPGPGGTGGGGVPDRLELRERLELGSGEVALVTYDATGKRLVLVR
jgi:hypothetical protein